MVFDAVSMDEKMDSSSESSGFASAVSIMNRDSVTPVSEQTSEKMGAVGATRSSVAACVFSGRGARSRRTNAFLPFFVAAAARSRRTNGFILFFVAAAAPSRRTNGFILFERSFEACSQCCGGVVQRSSFPAVDPHSRFGTPLTNLKGRFGIAV